MWLSRALLLLSLPGCFSIEGPKYVQGHEQGSLTVQCRYTPEWTAHSKWWCRGGRWRTCSILVQTRGTEQEETRGRVSIRDNQRDHSFQVTVEKLRLDDSGTYWCGIEKSGTDLGVQVRVTVHPVRTDAMSSKPVGWPTDSSLGVSSGSYKRTHYMLLVFLKVPILLALAGVILWLKGSRRIPRERPTCGNLDFELVTADTAPQAVGARRLPPGPCLQRSQAVEEGPLSPWGAAAQARPLGAGWAPSPPRTALGAARPSRGSQAPHVHLCKDRCHAPSGWLPWGLQGWSPPCRRPRPLPGKLRAQLGQKH